MKKIFLAALLITANAFAQKSSLLHLIADDIYIEVEFTSWSQGKQGGFSYQRTTQD